MSKLKQLLDSAAIPTSLRAEIDAEIEQLKSQIKDVKAADHKSPEATHPIKQHPPADIHVGLDELDIKVFETLQADRPLSSPGIANKLEIPLDDIKQKLKRLQQKGYITFTETWEGVFYNLDQKGRLVLERRK